HHGHARLPELRWRAPRVHGAAGHRAAGTRRAAPAGRPGGAQGSVRRRAGQGDQEDRREPVRGPALDARLAAGEHGRAGAGGAHRAGDARRQVDRVPPVQHPPRRPLRKDRAAERRHHLGDQRAGDEQPGQGAGGLHEAQDGQPPVGRPRAERPESHHGLHHPMKTTTSISRAAATVLVTALAMATTLSARAAIVEGADQKATRVQPGAPAAPAAAPTPNRRPERRRPPAITPAAQPAAAGTIDPATGTVIGEKEFNSCKKFPSGKRIVKLNLKPDTELGDLISWISSITCKQFLLPGTIPANSKKVTIVAPELITPEEAYRLFLGALDSVGLTVQPSGKVLRIIETANAKTAPIPLYGEDSDVPSNESYVTRLVRVENADPNEVAQVFGRLKGPQGDVIVYAPQGALIVTDLASNINRMMAILKEIDQPGTGERVWIVGVKNTSASDMAQKLGEIFQVAKL